MLGLADTGVRCRLGLQSAGNPGPKADRRTVCRANHFGKQTFSRGVHYQKSDPVDHALTFRRHAGETFTHDANAPGLAGSTAVIGLGGT